MVNTRTTTSEETIHSPITPADQSAPRDEVELSFLHQQKRKYEMTNMDKFFALQKLKEEAREEVDKYEKMKKKAWRNYFKYRDEEATMRRELAVHGESTSPDAKLERDCKRVKAQLADTDED